MHTNKIHTADWDWAWSHGTSPNRNMVPQLLRTLNIPLNTNNVTQPRNWAERFQRSRHDKTAAAEMETTKVARPLGFLELHLTIFSVHPTSLSISVSSFSDVLRWSLCWFVQQQLRTQCYTILLFPIIRPYLLYCSGCRVYFCLVVDILSSHIMCWLTAPSPSACSWCLDHWNRCDPALLEDITHRADWFLVVHRAKITFMHMSSICLRVSPLMIGSGSGRSCNSLRIQIWLLDC